MNVPFPETENPQRKVHDMILHIDVAAALDVLDSLHVDHRLLSAYHIRAFLPTGTIDIWPTTRRYHRIDTNHDTVYYNDFGRFLIYEQLYGL